MIDKLEIEKDNHLAQRDMYKLQVQELTDEIQGLQSQIDKINNNRIELNGLIKVREHAIEELDIAIRIIEEQGKE